MNNSVEYKKSIEEARRSIEMLVKEFKETTMSPSLIDRSYYEEKPHLETKDVVERNIEDIKKDIQSLVEEYRTTALPVTNKEKKLTAPTVAETSDKRTIASIPQSMQPIFQNNNKAPLFQNEPSEKKKKSSGIASTKTKSALLQNEGYRKAGTLKSPGKGAKEREWEWAKGNELKRKAEADMARRLKEEAEEKERLARVYERATSGASRAEPDLPDKRVQYKEKSIVADRTASSSKSISVETHTTANRSLQGNHFSKNRKAPTNGKSVLQNADITAHDFVVRLGVLKCRNKGHHVQDIQATFTTISRMGNVTKITVPAGYCPNCKMYFIMDSIYQRIKHSGIPICRTMDEKSYNSSAGLDMSVLSSYGNLAQESVLKQFGYSVSQEEDLSREQRRNILSAIMDYNVLTKSEIISYLEYFINSRKKQKNADGSLKFREALERWREDLDWIGGYKIGTFREVAIKRIITNK